MLWFSWNSIHKIQSVTAKTKKRKEHKKCLANNEILMNILLSLLLLLLPFRVYINVFPVLFWFWFSDLSMAQSSVASNGSRRFKSSQFQRSVFVVVSISSAHIGIYVYMYLPIYIYRYTHIYLIVSTFWLSHKCSSAHRLYVLLFLFAFCF